MMKRTLLLTIVLLVVCVLPVLALSAAAQDSGGQFWVQAFEDRNGNGAHDPGEPFLTSGVSVDLLNADGVVMASGTLDDAPFASRGFVGFLYLAPGSYTAVISSPDLTPTTADRVDVTIAQGEAPVTVLYGAQRGVPVEAAASGGTLALPNSDLARVAVAGIAAMIVVGGMTILGVLIYLAVLRRRAPVAVRRTTTGSMRPVRVDQTGEVRQSGEMRRTGEVRQSGEIRRTGETRQTGEIDRQ